MKDNVYRPIYHHFFYNSPKTCLAIKIGRYSGVMTLSHVSSLLTTRLYISYLMQGLFTSQRTNLRLAIPHTFLSLINLEKVLK